MKQFRVEYVIFVETSLYSRAVWKIEKFKYSKKTNDFQWDSQNDEVLQKKFFPKVLIFIGNFNFMGLK